MINGYSGVVRVDGGALDISGGWLNKANWNLGTDFNLDDDGLIEQVVDVAGGDNSVFYELKEGANDGDIKSLALSLSTRIEYVLNRLERIGKPVFISYMMQFCENYGVRYPQENDLDGIVARLICVKWWTKKLRISHARKCEAAQIERGQVSRVKDLYCSNQTLKRRVKQLQRNAETLEGITIQNESGYKMTLAEAAAVGMANPHNRVSELLTRVKGLGELADKYKHMCIFITITAPSKYHAMTYSKKTGKAHKNKNYQNFTPSETQKYLTGQWAKCRAKLAREGVKFYGLRVVEPHHDATPHWHGSIWLKSEADFVKFRRAVKDYFLRASECEYKERGAINNRLKFKRCDSRGAVGYMLKYILKNMRARAAGGDSDEGEITSAEGAERVEAWATTWAIRQFQQIGGHSVTVWRELRRVDESELEKAGFGSLDKLMIAWKAAQKVADKKANYAEFIEAMGGLETKPRDSWVKLDDEYLVSEGIYGKSISHLIHGVIDVKVNFTVKNNRQEWVIL